jgi:hypothetical protein
MMRTGCGKADDAGGGSGGFRLAACLFGALWVVSCAGQTREIVEPIWSYRMEKPPAPWASGRGESTFAEIDLGGDFFFHNLYTGGLMVVRAFPLSFRYRHFELSDHARRIYRAVLEGWGNDMRAIKAGRFLPLDRAWTLKKTNGLERLEFQLRGGLSRPLIDEQAEKKRIEDEVLFGVSEERFGPETRKAKKERIEREQSRTQVTRGAQGKFVLILRRGAKLDILYEFIFLDRELAFRNTVKDFNRMVKSFRVLQ